MKSYKINWYADQYEYGRYHVLDKAMNLVYQYQKLEEFELIRVREEQNISVDNDEALEKRFILENDDVISYDEEKDAYLGTSAVGVYLPVYDVKNAVDEEYSFYEDQDRVGFVKAIAK